MDHAIEGACAMACWVIGLFFLRYWRNSADRLFLFFLAAFWTFAVNWIGLAALQPTDDTRHWFYVVRLLAFGLIIAGIIDKNRTIANHDEVGDRSPKSRGPQVEPPSDPPPR